MSRIHDADKSPFSLWIGVICVIAAASGVWWYFHQAEPERDPSGKPYLRLVPTNAKLRARLSDAQYHVTRENGTETAFQNLYWNQFKPGLYVDVITGEPLFSSQDKFDSNTGRPSFTKPIAEGLIVEKEDTSFDMKRTEIRTVRSDSHLGHLFMDGPPPTNRRYAVNSAALHFVPLERFEAEHYQEFLPLFPAPANGQPSPSAASTPAK